MKKFSHADAQGGRRRCDLCGTCFASQKSLILHEQSQHGRRSALRYFAGADATCGACKVCFGTRLRLLKHLSDKRRPRCREVVVSSIVPLSDDEVLRLDELDRVARQDARNDGLSYVPSCSQIFKDGKALGVCRG